LRVVGISGASGSGKTLLLESLARKLSGKGFNVAAVKCAALRLFDTRGKDTDRALRSGATMVIGLASEQSIAFFSKMSLREALHLLPPVDYVLVEGCQEEPLPRIWVGEERPRALASWKPGEKLDRVIAKIDSLPPLPVSLTVDGRSIAMNPFVQDVVSSVARGIASALKGVKPEGMETLTLKINFAEIARKTSRRGSAKP